MDQVKILPTCAIALSLLLSANAFSADNGLITKSSNYSAKETTERFERAVKEKGQSGWIVFGEIDHASAAANVDLKLRPRTVVVFGNPKLGTMPMQKAPSLAIDVPLKALVWEDDQGKVWLTYNSAEYLSTYVYPRHGLSMPPDAVKGIERFLADVSEQGTR
ncbi:MAG: hypothetical protein V7642_5133 [Burkholderiales bacterium]|jgi:uncharacterized protein (DUF302 family)